MQFRVLFFAFFASLCIFLSTHSTAQSAQALQATIQTALSNQSIKNALNTFSNNSSTRSSSKITPRPPREKPPILNTTKSPDQDSDNKDTNQRKDMGLDTNKIKYVPSDIETMLNKGPYQEHISLPEFYHDTVPTSNLSYYSDEEASSLSVPQFGYDIFQIPLMNTTDMTIPVNDDYLLGAGDSLLIHIWGKLDEAIEATINKQGNIYIPKTGNIMLSGVPFKKAKKIIKKALERQYVNFELSVSMGELKTIKVFILGDVEYPGAYDVSSLSTLFTALHAAGGPSKKGSLRNILLKRNTKTVATVDLYDYLLNGNNSNDPILKNYDTIFVPPIGSVVKVTGQVKRPAIYELKNKTSVYKLIYSLAGGIWGTANEHHIKLKRVNKNTNHTFMDLISTDSNTKTTLKKTFIQNNDQFHVSSILNDTRNTVRIKGMVKSPGIYGFEPNMTLATLISKAKGLKPDSNLSSLRIYRYVSNQQRKVIFPKALTSKDRASIKLKEWDIVEVDKNLTQYVSIKGSVFKPGSYQIFDSMRISDLIQLAKLKPEADSIIELAHVDILSGKTTISQVNATHILSNYNHPSNHEIKLNSTVYVRSNASALTPRTVTLTGQVNFPGQYPIKKEDTLASLISRAGGFTNSAFKQGLSITRESIRNQELTSYDFFLDEEQKRLLFQENNLQQDSALKFINGQKEKAIGRLVISEKTLNDLTQLELEHNDIVHIPEITKTIAVIGGVQSARGVLFKPKKGIKYYVKEAGGFNDYARKRHIYVFSPNGSIKKNPKHIQMGDTIYVPQEEKEKLTFSIFLNKANTNLSFIVNALTSIYLIQSLNN